MSKSKTLTLMKSITDYAGRNKKTIMLLIETDNFPAKKIQGRWTSNEDLIDHYFERKIQQSDEA